MTEYLNSGYALITLIDSIKTLYLTDLIVSYYVYSVSTVVGIQWISAEDFFPYELLKPCHTQFNSQYPDVAGLSLQDFLCINLHSMLLTSPFI